VPEENASEASVIEEISVIPVDNFLDLVAHLLEKTKIEPAPKTDLENFFR